MMLRSVLPGWPSTSSRPDALPSFLLGLVLTTPRKPNGGGASVFRARRAGTYVEAHLFAAKLLMTDGQLKRAKLEIQIVFVPR